MNENRFEPLCESCLVGPLGLLRVLSGGPFRVNVSPIAIIITRFKSDEYAKCEVKWRREGVGGMGVWEG